MDQSHSCTTKMHETIVPHTGERRLLNMFGAQAGSAEGSAERQRQSRPQLGHQCVGGPHLGAPLPCVAGEIRTRTLTQIHAHARADVPTYKYTHRRTHAQAYTRTRTLRTCMHTHTRNRRTHAHARYVHACTYAIIHACTHTHAHATGVHACTHAIVHACTRTRNRRTHTQA